MLFQMCWIPFHKSRRLRGAFTQWPTDSLMSRVKVGIVGSRFQADCIAASVKMVADEAEVVAVASPTPGNAEAFAARHGIARAYADYRDLLRDPEVELVSITAPNYLHAEITIAAAAAGKHVV